MRAYILYPSYRQKRFEVRKISLMRSDRIEGLLYLHTEIGSQIFKIKRMKECMLMNHSVITKFPHLLYGADYNLGAMVALSGYCTERRHRADAAPGLIVFP